MRLIFLGSAAFAVPTLEALLAAGHDVCLVVSQPDRPAGRGRRLAPPPLARFAAETGLPLLQPPGLKDPDVQAQLAALQPAAMVVVAYGRLLPAAVLALPPLGCLNVHPSLLPRHRGPSPVAGALLAGDLETGVTVMLLDERMDAGPILVQERTRIGADEDAVTLESRLATAGARLLVQALPDWAARVLRPIPQDEGAATYTTLLRKEQGRLDWSAPADQLARQVRAFAGWPGAFTSWRGAALKVLRVTALDDAPPDLAPGTVYRVTGEDGSRALACRAGRGGLRLDLVELPGRRPMTGWALAQGHADIVGAQLGAS
jgi:methionyl-tRNA formyltransferase